MSTLNSAQLTLPVTHFNADGIGCARHEGLTLKLPGTVPGDTALVEFDTSVKPWRLKTLSITERASTRRNSLCCPHLSGSPICGGCTWGMLSEQEQARLKQQLLTNALAEAGISLPFTPEHIPAKETRYYRSKASFVPMKTPDGHWQWALYAPLTHERIPVTHCQAIAPWMNEAAAAVAACLAHQDLSIYDEQKHEGVVRGLLMREGVVAGQSERMVILIVNGDAELLAERLGAALSAALDSLQVKAIGLNAHQAPSNAVLGRQTVMLTDTTTICTDIDGCRFTVGPNTFLQIHRTQMEKLYQLALDWAALTEQSRFLDLYCGIGTMTILGARVARQAIGVDIVAESILAAQENARLNGVADKTDFFAGPVEQVLPALLTKGVRVDRIIVDPAYRGMEENVPAMLGALGATRLVYVSCNPKSFARDAARLLEQGFQIERLATLDLFPDTAHVETVALMSRA